MKATIRIPTKEYSFVEPIVEVESFEELREVHDKLHLMFGDKEGLNTLEWARVRNTYANTGEITIEDSEACSKIQRWCIGQFKKAFKSNKE